MKSGCVFDIIQLLPVVILSRKDLQTHE